MPLFEPNVSLKSLNVTGEEHLLARVQQCCRAILLLAVPELGTGGLFSHIIDARYLRKVFQYLCCQSQPCIQMLRLAFISMQPKKSPHCRFVPQCNHSHARQSQLAPIRSCGKGVQVLPLHHTLEP
jgi:hypothetical protein